MQPSRAKRCRCDSEEWERSLWHGDNCLWRDTVTVVDRSREMPLRENAWVDQKLPDSVLFRLEMIVEWMLERYPRQWCEQAWGWWTGGGGTFVSTWGPSTSPWRMLSTTHGDPADVERGPAKRAKPDLSNSG